MRTSRTLRAACPPLRPMAAASPSSAPRSPWWAQVGAACSCHSLCMQPPSAVVLPSRVTLAAVRRAVWAPPPSKPGGILFRQPAACRLPRRSCSPSLGMLSRAWGSNVMLPCAPRKQARAVASSAVQTAEEHALQTTTRRLCGRCGELSKLPQHRASQTCLTDRLGSSLRHATCWSCSYLDREHCMHAGVPSGAGPVRGAAAEVQVCPCGTLLKPAGLLNLLKSRS